MYEGNYNKGAHMRPYRDQTSWSNDQGSLDGGTPPIHALFMKSPKPKKKIKAKQENHCTHRKKVPFSLSKDESNLYSN